MLIDTHCHLDAPCFDADREAVIAKSVRAGVACIVVPAVAPDNFETVRALAHQRSELTYALGVHPLFTDKLPADWLQQLRAALERNRDDPRLVAVGEIGLDNFIDSPDVATQERVYVEQLKLAKEFELPVILHVRHSQDRLLKYLRQVPVSGGLAHAFNGSEQQALRFIEFGFALGFGGAMTFARAHQIRRLAASVSTQGFVLETDSPDMAPEWINRERNDPTHLPAIATVMADLRETDVETILTQSTANARRCLPRLARWLGLQASRP